MKNETDIQAIEKEIAEIDERLYDFNEESRRLSQRATKWSKARREKTVQLIKLHNILAEIKWTVYIDSRTGHLQLRAKNAQDRFPKQYEKLDEIWGHMPHDDIQLEGVGFISGVALRIDDEDMSLRFDRQDKSEKLDFIERWGLQLDKSNLEQEADKLAKQLSLVRDALDKLE